MAKKKKAKSAKSTKQSEKLNVTPYPQAGDNPEFVQQLEDLKKVGHGGTRPGAGRPAGTTEKVIAADKMGSAANPAIVGLLKLPFELWSQLSKVDSLALDDKEAEMLALPATQLINYYMPAMDNPVYFAWASLIGTASYVMLPRLYELKKLRDKKASIAEQAGAEQDGLDARRATDGAGAGPVIVKNPEQIQTGPQGFPTDKK